MLRTHLENMIDDVKWGDCSQEDDAYQYALSLIEDYKNDGELSDYDYDSIMTILEDTTQSLYDAFVDIILYLTKRRFYL